MSRLERRAIGLKFGTSCSEPFFLYRGMTLAVFSLKINLPVVKERLKISVSMEEICFKRRCRTLLGMLNGPVDLCGSCFFMMATISSGLIGVKRERALAAPCNRESFF